MNNRRELEYKVRPGWLCDGHEIDSAFCIICFSVLAEFKNDDCTVSARGFLIKEAVVLLL